MPFSCSHDKHADACTWVLRKPSVRITLHNHTSALETIFRYYATRDSKASKAAHKKVLNTKSKKNLNAHDAPMVTFWSVTFTPYPLFVQYFEADNTSATTIYL
eukprot:SAG31_NODE_3370_length_4353_cov_5.039962_5_plen_103_part_00